MTEVTTFPVGVSPTQGIVDDIVEAHRCIVCSRLDARSKDAVRQCINQKQVVLDKRKRKSVRTQEGLCKKLKTGRVAAQMTADLELFPQLRPFFVLKEVFKCSLEDTGEEMLMRLGNPVEWFDICKWCRRLVDEGIELHRKLVRYTREYDKVKETLVGLLEEMPEESAFLANCKKPVPEELVEKSRARLSVRKRIRGLIPNVVAGFKGPEKVEVKMEVDMEEYVDQEYDDADVASEDAQENQLDQIYLSEFPRGFKRLDPDFKATCKIKIDSPVDRVRKSLRARKIPKYNMLGDEEDVDHVHHHGNTRSKDDQWDFDALEEQDRQRLLRLRRMRMKLKKIKSKKQKLQKSKVVVPRQPKLKPKSDRARGRPIKDKNLQLNKKMIESGYEFLNMSLFTYPPTTQEERAKIPEQPVANLKDYGHLSGSKTSEFRCPSKICNKYFRNKYYAIAHIHRFHLGINKPWKCTQCSYKFKIFEKLFEHLKLHETGQLIVCPVCNDFCCQNQEKMNFHILNHQKNVHNPVCERCQKTYKNFQTLVTHMTTEHGFSNPFKIKTRLVCELCSIEFRTRKQLEFHYVITHNHPDEQGKFPICSDCGKKELNEALLQRHVNKYHLKQKEFCCDQCGESFAVESTLLSHYLRHHRVNQKPCPVCGFLTKNEISWQSHITRLHPEVKNMSMEEIAEYSKRANEEMSHKCSQCERRFGFKNLLYHHYRNEHKEVTDRFKCDLCGKGYSRACSVKRHYEAVHAKLAVRCEYCDKVFYGKESVYQHQKAHCPAKREAKEKDREGITDNTDNNAVDVTASKSYHPDLAPHVL